jgi:AMP-binding enzyme C-terminal domain
MLGYWNDPEATRLAVDADGWMHTGDLAVMDADGDLSIVGRIKDMIIRGAENLCSREIEEFLHGLSGVADAHVIGIPSERYGEEVMAWVKPHTGAALTPAGLAAACRGRIASFKIPAHWRIVDSFPMTVTGRSRSTGYAISRGRDLHRLRAPDRRRFDRRSRSQRARRVRARRLASGRAPDRSRDDRRRHRAGRHRLGELEPEDSIRGSA